MEPRIIKTQEQYRRYLVKVERLVARDPDSASTAGGRLEFLARLVEDYEKTRYMFRKPGAVEAILFRMEEQGLRQKDIAEILGGKNRASEVLSRKRNLTLPMIRALYEKLAISPELLIREPAAVYRAGTKAEAARKTKSKQTRSAGTKTGRLALRAARPERSDRLGDQLAFLRPLLRLRRISSCCLPSGRGPRRAADPWPCL